MINLLLQNSFFGDDTRTCRFFLAAAIVSQTVGYISISYALGHLPARIVSPTLIGQPIMITILAIPLLSEIPSLIQAIGGLVALAGIYVVNQPHGTNRKRTSNNLSALWFLCL